MTSVGYNLGSAYGNVIISTNVANAMSEAQRSFDAGIAGMSASIKAWGDSITQTGAQLTVLTTPLRGFITDGLSVVGQFDDIMTEIQARTGATTEDMAAIREEARRLGAESVFSAQEAGDALLQLLTSGMNTQEALATLPFVLDAAAASGESLGTTADSVTDIMAAFGLGVEDAESIVNSLARAAGATSADMGSLSQGFANVGGVAKNFGLSVNDTAAILGIFAENGIKGAEAGTQLKSMLLNMSRDTEDTQAAWTRLGVSMYDVNGNVRSLDSVIADLDASLDKLPVEEQNKLMMDLAGSYGITGLTALRNSISIGEMTGRMNEQADASDIAGAKMGTLNNMVDSAKGSWETFMEVVLAPLVEQHLKPLIASVTEVINQMTAWAQANPEIAGALAMLGAALAVLGPALIGVGTAVSFMGAGLGVILSPVGLLLAGVAALGVAFATNFGGIRDLVMPIVETVANGLANVGDVLGRVSGVFGDEGIVGTIRGFFTVFEDGSSYIGAILEGFGMSQEQATALGATIAEAFGGIITTFEGFVGFVTTTVLPALQGLFNWLISEVFPALVDVVINSVLPAIQSFTDFLSQLWTLVQPHLQALADWFLTTALPAIQAFITGTIIPGIEQFIQTLTRIWNDVSPFLIQLADWFLNTALPAVVNFITGTVIPGVQGFIDLLLGIWAQVEPTLTQLYDWFVTTALPAIVDFITNTVVPAVQDFFALIENVWTQISPGLEQLRAWFMDTALPAIRSFLVDTVGPAIRDFFAIIEGAWALISPVLTDIYNWFVVTALPEIKKFIDSVGERVNEFIRTLQGIWNAVQGPLNTLKDGITSALQPIIDLINTLKGGFDSLTGMANQQQGARDAVAESGISKDELWQRTLAASGGNDFLARIAFAGLEDVPKYATGADYIATEGLAVLHPGEGVLTAEQNAARLSGDQKPSISIGAIYANSEAEGRAAMRGIKDEFEQWSTFNG